MASVRFPDCRISIENHLKAQMQTPKKEGSKYGAVRPHPAAKARLSLARGQAPVASPSAALRRARPSPGRIRSAAVRA